ncbi:hypothetical protein WR25_13537 isoform B [Diploscapter pachys]|uniref:Uncharacterized protein n=1 Tax=Diploscapter pachys TaxID=2018661 RepID=A0A2A2JCQ6_9BILA|nr:hypothetical protein WR25_13537 isoform B [Diploscapter pachys]
MPKFLDQASDFYDRHRCLHRCDCLVDRRKLVFFKFIYFLKFLDETGSDVTPHDASINFTVFINQYTGKDGTFTVTYRKANGEENTGPGEHKIHSSFWYQSHTNEVLVHKLNENMTIYAMSTHSFWYKNDGISSPSCTYDPRMNYYAYINNLGMTSLTREHSEIESTKHHTRVYIYQGNPNEVAIIGTRQRAFLVTTYADSVNGVLLGWDTYFASDMNSDTVYEMSYWYDNMIASEPSSHLMVPPKECVPSDQAKV